MAYEIAEVAIGPGAAAKPTTHELLLVGAPHHVLVVDDEDDVREAIGMRLQSEGFARVDQQARAVARGCDFS